MTAPEKKFVDGRKSERKDAEVLEKTVSYFMDAADGLISVVAF